MDSWDSPYWVKPRKSKNKPALSDVDTNSGSLEVRDSSRNVSNEFGANDIVNVTCGALTGKLHFRMFTCPGIHQMCIQVDGSNEIISPKQFTVRANKDKQKDWKGCIRIGKRSLRLLMALGLLEYHNHQEFCSLKCQSRNHIRGRPDNYRINQKLPTTPEHIQETSIPTFPPVSDYTPNTFFLSAPSKNADGTQQAISVFKDNNDKLNNLPDINNLPNPIAPIAFSTSPLEAGAEQTLINLLHTDPVSFWRELHRVDIINDVIARIINRLKECASYDDLTNVSMNLSRVVTALNLQYEVVQMFNEKQYANLNDPVESVFGTPNSSMQEDVELPVDMEKAVNKNDEYYLLNMLERSPENKVSARREIIKKNCDEMLYELPAVTEKNDDFTITIL